MRNIIALFIGDLRRITSNIVSIIIVIGLVAIPSLFAWFNIAASWDPFGNMKDLKFAVANMDEGYRSDLMPMKVTVGAEVVNALRANTELDWTFTTKDQAIEGTKSGKYYAAIVIPKNFSATMMTFFSKDAKHASIAYYSNEKKNAIAPNLTNEGADQVAEQVNEMFAEMLTTTALNIASALVNQLDTPEAKNMLDRFNANIGDFATRLNSTADTLGSFSVLTDSAQSLLGNSTALVKQASKTAGQAGSQIDQAKQGVSDVSGALSGSVDIMHSALEASSGSFDQVGKDMNRLLDDANNNVTVTCTALRNQAQVIGQQRADYESLRAALLNIPGITGQSPIVRSLDRTINQLSALQNKLNGTADDLERHAAESKAQREQIQTLIRQAQSSIAGIGSGIDTDLTPQINAITAAAQDASTVLDSSGKQISDTVDKLDETANDAKKTVGNVRTALDGTAKKLRNTASKLTKFNESLANALASGDMAKVKEVLGGDTQSLASALAAPIKLERKAVFPVENFGSAMTPYYTFIPLWTASILIALVVKITVSRRQRAQLGEPLPHQMFLGRFSIFALISLLQSTVSCGGSLLFLHVQAVHPLLFMLSGWVGGLVFVFFIYTLVVSFGNIGKAIGMLLLVFQVSGSAGSYPLQTLPEFMQWLSPFLPITHAINAMRAAIAGVYRNDYWIELGKLLLFVPPLLLLGLVLRKPLIGFNRWMTAQLEKTKLIG